MRSESSYEALRARLSSGRAEREVGVPPKLIASIGGDTSEFYIFLQSAICDIHDGQAHLDGETDRKCRFCCKAEHEDRSRGDFSAFPQARRKDISPRRCLLYIVF